MLEDQVLEGGEFLDLLALARQFLGGDRLVALERLDGERPGHAQPLFVFERLVVKRLFRRRLVVGDAAERDVRHLLVDEAVADIAAAQWFLGIALFERIMARFPEARPGNFSCAPCRCWSS